MATRRLTGIATILLAIAFNVPFALLGSSFDYPDILRRPAADVLERFHTGGASLVLTWYAFMLSAVFMVPVVAALGVHLPTLRTSPALRMIGVSSGFAAGLLQAIGLSRWVFAVPQLARIQSDPQSSDLMRSNAQSAFDLLNHWGGVAIGEHLGQIFTVLFVLSLAISQIIATGKWNRAAGAIGLLTAIFITIGLGEGIMIATGADTGILGLFSVFGYLGLTLWLIATGVSLLRKVSLTD
ncbi:MAG: hypothetical protein JWM58_3439 [Rhizobium sp.]|nr:hypothetical protein [Rhizobium sp.]